MMLRVITMVARNTTIPLKMLQLHPQFGIKSGRLLYTFNRLLYSFSTIQNLPGQNSIKPSREDGYAYGHYFPSDWDEHTIKKTLDPKDHHIQVIKLVRNRVGEPTGKVLFKFRDERTLKKYMDQYHEDYLVTDSETRKIVILPFELKTELAKRDKPSYQQKYAVRLSNLDFDITAQELAKLAHDYDPLAHVELT